jgi:hypothetical protein
MAVYLGLDIGGTKFMVAAADEQGKFLRRERAAASTSLDEDLATLNQMIAKAAAGEAILGMGAAWNCWRSSTITIGHQKLFFLLRGGTQGRLSGAA